jgi:chitinase
MNVFRLKNSNSTNHKFNQCALVLITFALAGFAVLPVQALTAVAAPVFNPVGGAYPTFPKTITITCATAGASIRYTTGGANPTPTYGNLISSGGTASVAAGQTLKAIAYKTGFANSTITSAAYTLAAKVATPTFAPDGQTSDLHSVSVTISCSTSGATIRYTTDRSTPTSTHGTIITSGSRVTIFPPAAGMTLKAMAYKSGLTNSAVKSADYYWDASGGR